MRDYLYHLITLISLYSRTPKGTYKCFINNFREDLTGSSGDNGNSHLELTEHTKETRNQILTGCDVTSITQQAINTYRAMGDNFDVTIQARYLHR